ncbi:MAG: undecaprenyl-diphosphate phosphatase [Atribacterota bacterium]|nr:undecaprenyl-diphosphate phosphatase [Atribacterota bacterium]
MYYVILGLIQGLTEFLPISSSGHLVLGKYLLKLEMPGVAFETFLHFVTTLAVLFLFKKDIAEIIISFIKSLKYILHPKIFINFIKTDYQSKFAYLLIISTVPGAFFGYFLQDFFKQIFSSPIITALMLLITGLCLFFTDTGTRQGNKQLKDITIADAILIGLAQALAIVPGLSRSGFTIMMSLTRKLDRKFAAKYSFILSVPIILGATLFEMKEISRIDINLVYLIFAGIITFLTGYWAMNFFIKMLVNFKLKYFSFYLWFIGLAVIIYNYNANL